MAKKKVVTVPVLHHHLLGLNSVSFSSYSALVFRLMHDRIVCALVDTPPCHFGRRPRVPLSYGMLDLFPAQPDAWTSPPPLLRERSSCLASRLGSSPSSEELFDV